VRAGEAAALERLAAGVRALLVRVVAPRLAGGWTAGRVEDVVSEAVLDVLRAHPHCRAGFAARDDIHRMNSHSRGGMM
jgi:DNA-directed RNA polymerase specialized sigma24 family protein